MNDKAEQKISSELPDWSREKPRKFWDPSCKLLCSSLSTSRGGIPFLFCDLE